jgi:hypothetical protein
MEDITALPSYLPRDLTHDFARERRDLGDAGRIAARRHGEPWRRAFCAARALPAAVRGPVLRRALRRLASIRLLPADSAAAPRLPRGSASRDRAHSPVNLVERATQLAPKRSRWCSCGTAPSCGAARRRHHAVDASNWNSSAENVAARCGPAEAGGEQVLDLFHRIVDARAPAAGQQRRGPRHPRPAAATARRPPRCAAQAIRFGLEPTQPQHLPGEIDDVAQEHVLEQVSRPERARHAREQLVIAARLSLAITPAARPPRRTPPAPAQMPARGPGRRGHRAV